MATIWMRNLSSDTFTDLDAVQRFVDSIFIQYRDTLRCPSCGAKNALILDQTGGGARGGRRFRRYKHKCAHSSSGRTFTIGMADMLMTLLAPIFQKTASQTTNTRRKEALGVLKVMSVALQRMRDLGQRIDSTNFQARLEKLREIDEQLEAALQAGLLEQDERMHPEATRSPSPHIEDEHSHDVIVIDDEDTEEIVETRRSARVSQVEHHEGAEPFDYCNGGEEMPTIMPNATLEAAGASVLAQPSPELEETNAHCVLPGQLLAQPCNRAVLASIAADDDQAGSENVPISIDSTPEVEDVAPTPQITGSRQYCEQCVGTEPSRGSPGLLNIDTAAQPLRRHLLTPNVAESAAKPVHQSRRTRFNPSGDTSATVAKPRSHVPQPANCNSSVAIHIGGRQAKRLRQGAEHRVNTMTIRSHTGTATSPGASPRLHVSQPPNNVRIHIRVEDRTAPANTGRGIRSMQGRAPPYAATATPLTFDENEARTDHLQLPAPISRALTESTSEAFTYLSVAYLNVCGLTEEKWQLIFRAFSEMDKPEQAGLLILSETRRPRRLTETLLNGYSRWIRAATPAPERSLTQDPQSPSPEVVMPHRPGGGMLLLCHPALSPYLTILSITPYSCTFSVSLPQGKQTSPLPAWHVHAVYLPPSMGRLQEFSVFKSFLCPPGHLKPDLLLGDLNVRFGTEADSVEGRVKGPLGRLDVVNKCLEDLQLVKLVPNTAKASAQSSLFQKKTDSRVDHAFVRNAPTMDGHVPLRASLTVRVAPIDTDHPLMRVRVRPAAT